MPDPDNDAFSKQAEGKRRGAVAEFFSFVANNKKWWLTPIILVLVLVGALAVFIYSLF